MSMAAKKSLEQRFEELCLDIGRAYGADDLTSKIICRLYLEPSELSLEEIAKKTGYSLSSVSKALKNIDRCPFLRKFRKPASKKVYFSLEKDLDGVFLLMLEKMLSAKLLPLKERLPYIMKQHQQKTNEQKLLLLKQLYRHVQRSEEGIMLLIKKMREA